MNKRLDEKNGKLIFCTQAKSGYVNYPSPFDSVYCSTQITLADPIPLPSQAPPCDKIMSHAHTLKIHHAKTIDSVEIIDGRPVKGKKIVVTGMIHLMIEYISCQDPSQKVYYLDWEQSFNAVIVQSSCDNHSLFPCHFNLSDYMVYIYAEYLQVSCKTEYVLDATIALRIWLQELELNQQRMCSEEGEGGLTLK